jgi:hypothetical protein
MNLQEQIGALEAGVDQLLQAAVARASRAAEAASADPQPAANPIEAEGAAPVHAQETHVPAEVAAAAAPQAGADVDVDVDADVAVEETVDAAEAAEAATAEAEPEPAAHIMQISRPSQNEITMTIGGQTVTLHPLQVGELIEQLSNARASMQPEPPPGIPQGWRFVSTKNPVMAVQKQSNGDRTLMLRHTGHGWVPFTFTPDMIVQMYMMLTQR